MTVAAPTRSSRHVEPRPTVALGRKAAGLLAWAAVARATQVSIAPSCWGPCGRGGSLRRRIPKGAVRRRDERGACRGEGLVAGEHVPDGLGELAAEVDLGDLRSALAAEAALGALVALFVDRVLAGVQRGLKERPAQVARAVLADGPAAVGVARLVNARAKPGVAAKLGWRGEAGDVADLRGDGERVDPAEPWGGDQQRDVAVIGALATHLDRQLGDLQLEVIDQLQARVDVAPPRIGDRHAVEQLAAGQAEEV